MATKKLHVLLLITQHDIDYLSDVGAYKFEVEY